MIVAVLATFCLTATLFMIVPTRSASTQSNGLQYDPWKDINDDGKLDILDVIQITSQYGAQGMPINKTQIILDLQNRVNALEDRQDCVKTIRLYTPNETVHYETLIWKDTAIFVWTPHNATDNAILRGNFYFKCLTPDPALLWFRLLINGHDVCQNGGLINTAYEFAGVYGFALDTTLYTPPPNQNSYAIVLQTMSNGYTSYVKDINILLEVMDGLPPS